MKRIILTFFMVVLFTGVILTQDQTRTEEDAVKDVITSAYIEGRHNLRDIEDMEKGFHPGFINFYVQNNQLNKYPIYSWIESVKMNKEKNPEPPEKKATIKFLLINVTGNTAISKFELYLNGKYRCTDSFMLLKFKEGWRIVAKISHRQN